MRAVASGMQPNIVFWTVSWTPRANWASIPIMTTDGVVKAAEFLRMNEESRWKVDNRNALRGLLWDATELEAEAAEAIQAPRFQIIHLFSTPRRRCVTRADLRKCHLAQYDYRFAQSNQLNPS